MFLLALGGMMGCWSLMGNNRTSISKQFCKGCEEYKTKTKQNTY